MRLAGHHRMLSAGTEYENPSGRRYRSDRCRFFFSISPAEWLVCLVLFSLVMGAELINTAIEAAVDLACPRENPKAKLAKDAAAGAVLICAIFAAMAGTIIFLPKLWNLIQ